MRPARPGTPPRGGWWRTDLQLARDVAELRDVDDALGRLDAGTYGDCAGCGEAIPASRLMAQPAVRLCAACQATREGLC